MLKELAESLEAIVKFDSLARGQIKGGKIIVTFFAPLKKESDLFVLLSKYGWVVDSENPRVWSKK